MSSCDVDHALDIKLDFAWKRDETRDPDDNEASAEQAYSTGTGWGEQEDQLIDDQAEGSWPGAQKDEQRNTSLCNDCATPHRSACLNEKEFAAATAHLAAGDSDKDQLIDDEAEGAWPGEQKDEQRNTSFCDMAAPSQNCLLAAEASPQQEIRTGNVLKQLLDVYMGKCKDNKSQGPRQSVLLDAKQFAKATAHISALDFDEPLATALLSSLDESSDHFSFESAKDMAPSGDGKECPSPLMQLSQTRNDCATPQRTACLNEKEFAAATAHLAAGDSDKDGQSDESDDEHLNDGKAWLWAFDSDDEFQAVPKYNRPNRDLVAGG